jgi:hypothetical protein
VAVELTSGLGVLSTVTMAATVEVENCSAVNSTAETSAQFVVLQHSKFEMKLVVEDDPVAFANLHFMR